MTNHWVDIKNADVVLIMGSNAAENHPVAFKWVMEAKAKNATIISVDPRFTRSSSKADIYAPMRSGTDIVFLGGMIKYAIDSGKINTQYLIDCTNAAYFVDPNFKTARGSAPDGKGYFSGWNAGTKTYTTTTWDYHKDGSGNPIKGTTLEGDCPVHGAACGAKTVFSHLKDQYNNYDAPTVESICGTPQTLFNQICQVYCDTCADEKSATQLYAMGWTQHTVGSQNIRAASILQMLLGNMGVAGGGINALRGWQNVQGSTDHAVLYDWFPGYIGYPENTAAYNTLANYIAAVTPTAVDPNPAIPPASGNWKSNFSKYITSTIKAWWPTIHQNIGYQYLPKRKGNLSHLSLFEDMLPPDPAHGKTTGNIIKGLFVWAQNPAVTGPDTQRETNALANLDWLVVCDMFHTETSDFWTTNTSNQTEVYLLPGSAFYERKGSVTNSGRLAQWKDKAGDPPGDALGGALFEEEILKRLGDAIKALYSSSTAPKDQGIKNLNWPCDSRLIDTLLVPPETFVEGVAKEIHGYTIVAPPAPLVLVTNFTSLTNTGTTACGNWLFSGTWANAADTITGNKNQMLNRSPQDYGTGNVIRTTNKIGIFAKWGYAWPVNRRIIYNRASVYQTGPNEGKPLAPDKWVIESATLGTLISPPSADATYKTGGDVVDGWATSRPQNVLPIIMNNDGIGHLMGIKKLADGPFPEHYEPKETPLTANPLTATGPISNPAAYSYPGATYASPGDPDYPIVATTYRLTEHWHGGGMTRNLPGLCQLMPEPFVEMSEKLADDLSIANGELVRVVSARGGIEVKACVTKRFKPFTIGGNEVHQVGLPWHWGFAALCGGASANVLTPHIGDANTRIPEYKAFLVRIEKL